MTAWPAVDDYDDCPTLWVGTTFTVATEEVFRDPHLLRAEDAVRMFVQLRGHSADGYDIRPAHGAYYAHHRDRAGPLLCALTPRGLAEEIIADLSGVALRDAS